MKPDTLLYIAPRLPPGAPPLVIDGDLSKAAWAAAPWSSPFQEIRGADAPDGSQPPAACVTRMKMLWDSEYLYVGAELASDFEVRATFTERNSPIFQQDSDFEVFVDAEGSCHAYKELEVNALNTVWNLLLTRPYADGGGEHSGRVAQPGSSEHYEARRQTTATRVLRGRLNAPEGAAWAVEIALCHSDTLARQPGAVKPAVGGAWRINFSRVERKGEVNWVWRPQVVWEPRRRRYEGKVNMHLPDAWGLVKFAPHAAADAGEITLPADSGAVAAHAAAMSVYYAQHAHREQLGAFAPSVAALRARALLDEHEGSAGRCEVEVSTEAGAAPAEAGEAFTACATDAQSGVSVSVTHDRRVRVKGTII